MSGRVPRIPIDVRTPCPPQPLPPCPYDWGDPMQWASEDLIAQGGDFAPSTIVSAYEHGLFPWPHSWEERLWFSPDPRAIIPVGKLHISRRLARRIRQGRFRVTLDAAFRQVMTECSVRPEGTWITPALVEGYTELHRLGWAHSFEVWTPDGDLVGGLYGVNVGALFGAESMFHRVTDASKVAMVAMMQHCETVGVTLVDIQVLTEHTASMGAVEVSRGEYLRRAREAVGRPFVFGQPLGARSTGDG